MTPNESMWEYMLRIISCLFHENPLVKHFLVLTGLLVLLEASKLHDLIDSQWSDIWETLRKERNALHKEKPKNPNGQTCSVCVCSNRVSNTRLPNSWKPLCKVSPQGYCMDHKIVAELFENRHSANKLSGDALASRLVHLLLPEPDEIHKEFDHASVFRSEAHAFPEPFTPKGKFPISDLLDELFANSHGFYATLTEALTKYKDEHPKGFPKL